MKSLRISAVELDLVTQAEALDKIKNFLTSTNTNFVLTPNAGQLTTYRKNQDLRDFLSSAQLRLIDGWPLAFAASLAEAKKWPRVTGSDLLPKLFETLDSSTRVGIIGGSDQNQIKAKLKNLYPQLNLVLVNDEFFADTEDSAKRIAQLCEEHQITILVLALGHPKQEVLAAYLKKYQVASLRVVLCFGASVDFLTGEQIRAPKFLQQIGLEWFYRLATNPKKFIKRYSQAVWPSLVLIVSAVRARFF